MVRRIINRKMSAYKLLVPEAFTFSVKPFESDPSKVCLWFKPRPLLSFSNIKTELFTKQSEQFGDSSFLVLRELDFETIDGVRQELKPLFHSMDLLQYGDPMKALRFEGDSLKFKLRVGEIPHGYPLGSEVNLHCKGVFVDTDSGNVYLMSEFIQ